MLSSLGGFWEAVGFNVSVTEKRSPAKRELITVTRYTVIT